MEEQPQTPPQKPRSRPVLVGGLLALIAGVVIAGVLVLSGRGERTPPPPASQAGLVIESGPEEGRIDPAKPLRCFVAGQLVGELTLTECARRNGVATDALDVGLDETGALAAAQEAGTVLTPLPPPEEAAPAEVVEPADPEASTAPPPVATAATCWRHQSGQWRRLPADMDLNACVQTLFARRCERAGGASYGRWGDQTLRLVTGKVEISSDNSSFRTLATQQAGCVIPPVG